MKLLTLGGLSLLNEDGTDAGQQPRRLALLALLCAARERGISRDRLVAILSPESSTESARHALEQLVYYLRRKAGENVFLGTRTLRLNPALMTSDLEDFESAIDCGDLARAVCVYRGPFLDGFHLDSIEFEDWLERERSRLAARHRDSLLRLAESADACGDYASAAERWRQLVGLEPLSGHFALGLMRALAAAGDSAGALRHARAHETLMRKELKLGLDREVSDFIARLSGSVPAVRRPVEVRQPEAPRPANESKSAPVDQLRSAAADIADASQRANSITTRPRSTFAPWLHRNQRNALFATAVMFALLGLVALRSVRDARANASGYARTAIAVLPFRDLTADSSNAYFAAGLHDELVTQLSKVPALRIPSRQSVMAYAEPHKVPLRTIARELRVGSVVEATVQVVGNRLRLNVQLIDAATDAHLWSEHFDRTLDDAFAIQSELARQIVEAVGVALTEAEARAVAAPYTRNPDAYRFYLQGREYFRNGRDLDIAEQLFAKAIALDPRFAIAHAWLSQVHGLKYLLRLDRSPERAERQRIEAEAALQLSPGLPEAHLALGSWHYDSRRDYPRALAELRIAADGLPNDPEVWGRIGQVTRRMGDWKQSLAAHERTVQLSPTDVYYLKELGVTNMYMRRYAEARAAYDESLALAPDFRFVHLLKALTYVYEKGQLDSLRDVLRGRPFTGEDDSWSMAQVNLNYWERRPDSMLKIAAVMPAVLGAGQGVYLPPSLYSARAHQLRGDTRAASLAFDSARVVLDSAVRTHPADEHVHAALGFALAGLGDRAGALRETSWVKTSFAYRNDHTQGRFTVMHRAQILAQLGDANGALDDVQRLLVEPGQTMLTPCMLRLDPRWDPIRSDARFQAISARCR